MKTAVVLVALSALVALARAQGPMAAMGGGGPMGMNMGMSRMMLPMMMGGMDMKHFAMMNMLNGGGGGGRMSPLMTTMLMRGNDNVLPLLLASKSGMNPLALMAMMGNDNMMAMLPFLMGAGGFGGGGGGGGGMRGPAGAGGAAGGPVM